MSTLSDVLTIDAIPENWRRHVQVDVASGCWLWTASKGRGGYGQLWNGTTMRRAHRAIYERLVGPVAPDLEMDHLCRVRACVNPAHLEPVTRQENQRRRRKHNSAHDRRFAYRARQRARRDAERIATGWWVTI